MIKKEMNELHTNTYYLSAVIEMKTSCHKRWVARHWAKRANSSIICSYHTLVLDRTDLQHWNSLLLSAELDACETDWLKQNITYSHFSFPCIDQPWNCLHHWPLEVSPLRSLCDLFPALEEMWCDWITTHHHTFRQPLSAAAPKWLPTTVNLYDIRLPYYLNHRLSSATQLVEPTLQPKLPAPRH
jgi:hypothetical protein